VLRSPLCIDSISFLGFALQELHFHAVQLIDMLAAMEQGERIDWIKLDLDLRRRPEPLAAICILAFSPSLLKWRVALGCNACDARIGTGRSFEQIRLAFW
jgi:hypothetical protein